MLEVGFVDVDALSVQPKQRSAKHCPSCKLHRYMFEFYVDRSNKDGHSKLCKDCQRFKDDGGDFNSDSFDILVEQWRERIALYQRPYQVMKTRVRRKVMNQISEQESLLYVATRTARAVVLSSHRRQGFSKSSKTSQILGCSYEDFRFHIESLFAPGMGWHNRELWHIDHIVPLASAKSVDDVVRLCHYTNLQPLWVKDNLAKK